MKGIVKRLREVNEDSLIMEVVRNCLDAAEEIERLREECTSQKQTIKEIKEAFNKE